MVYALFIYCIYIIYTFKNVKNRFYSTIYTFKNYFIIIFLIFNFNDNKLIQTDFM